ncbi:hypothetical protein [Undibacterium sp. Ji49W]|uniref:hypothetical protein n=1 Tax=Undibacterium sp. Ji49W TaxID=3413040 RepID=UPI003BF02D8A
MLIVSVMLIVLLIRMLRVSFYDRYSAKENDACSPAAVARFYPSRPRRSNGNRKPAWVIDAVLDLYMEENSSYRVTMYAFNRLYAHTGMSVSLNTVYVWVQKYRSERETIRVRTRNHFPAPAPANLRWCLDGTGKVDAGGVQHFYWVQLTTGRA